MKWGKRVTCCARPEPSGSTKGRPPCRTAKTSPKTSSHRSSNLPAKVLASKVQLLLAHIRRMSVASCVRSWQTSSTYWGTFGNRTWQRAAYVHILIHLQSVGEMCLIVVTHFHFRRKHDSRRWRVYVGQFCDVFHCRWASISYCVSSVVFYILCGPDSHLLICIISNH